MRILIAEDDAVSRLLLQRTLAGWGYEVEVTSDGEQAWEVLQGENRPSLAILDWMMPGKDGLEICTRARAEASTQGLYILLLTARGGRENMLAGLQAGADDFVTKPFDREELRARVGVGERVIELQKNLADRVRELEQALAHVKQLQGILPICCYCKKIRRDDDYWQRVEDYIKQHSSADFSHGICPECWETVVQPQMEEMWGTSVPYEEQ